MARLRWRPKRDCYRAWQTAIAPGLKPFTMAEHEQGFPLPGIIPGMARRSGEVIRGRGTRLGSQPLHHGGTETGGEPSFVTEHSENTETKPPPGTRWRSPMPPQPMTTSNVGGDAKDRDGRAPPDGSGTRPWAYWEVQPPSTTRLWPVT